MKKILRLFVPIIIWLVIYNVSNSGILLEFQDIDVEALRERFSEVHFVWWWNSFWWAAFWRETQWLSNAQEIEYWVGTPNYQKLSCKTQIRWLYYNWQRWLRLRPLDQATLNLMAWYGKLTMTWWFYRDCTSISWSMTSSIYSIYWIITYSLENGNGNKTRTSSLAAWVKLDINWNKMIAWMSNNFQYFNNATPIWYFYDSVWWIWFVWWALIGHDNLISFLNSGNTINDAFAISWISIVSRDPRWSFTNLTWINTAQDTLWNLLIQWTVWLSKSIDSDQRLSLLGNQEKRTIILWWAEINSSTILNLAKKNSQTLCRWRTLGDTSKSVICYNGNQNIDPTAFGNKTIIVNNWNVTLTQTMQWSSSPVEIFIDKWNLYLWNPSTLISFNKDGYPISSITSPYVISWMYLKGNFIVNWLMLWWSVWSITWFNHKLHIEGKVVSLNSPLPPAKWRTDQVAALFGNTWFNNWIDLKNVFSRYCDFQGRGSDWTSCSSWSIVSIVPFVVLNGNFAWQLLR